MSKETNERNSVLPEFLSVERIPRNRRPTHQDWVQIQGGMPEIQWENDRVCRVIHQYVNEKDDTGTGSVVTISIPALEKHRIKTITYNVNGVEKDFPVALLWKFYGKPSWIDTKGKGIEKVTVER